MKKILIVLMACLLISCSNNNENKLNNNNNNNENLVVTTTNNDNNEPIDVADDVVVEPEEEVIETLDTSDAIVLSKSVITKTVEPGESIEFLVTDSDNHQGAIAIRTDMTLKAVFHEVIIQESANVSFFVMSDQWIYQRDLNAGDEILIISNEQDEAITFSITRADNYDDLNSHIENLEAFKLEEVLLEVGVIVDNDGSICTIDNMTFFNENDMLGIAPMDGKIFVLIEGTIENIFEERKSMMRLFSFDIRDDNNKQQGDASSWLEDGDGYTFLEPNEKKSYQKLFMLADDSQAFIVNISNTFEENDLIFLINPEVIQLESQSLTEETEESEETMMGLTAKPILEAFAAGDFSKIVDNTDYTFFAYGETANTTDVFIESYQWGDILSNEEVMNFNPTTLLTFKDFYNTYFANKDFSNLVYTEELPEYDWLDHWENDVTLTVTIDAVTYYIMLSNFDVNEYALIGIGIIE